MDSTVFFLPFPLLRKLQLGRRQILGLFVTFTLGTITMAVSIGRFVSVQTTNTFNPLCKIPNPLSIHPSIHLHSPFNLQSPIPNPQTPHPAHTPTQETPNLTLHLHPRHLVHGRTSSRHNRRISSVPKFPPATTSTQRSARDQASIPHPPHLLLRLEHQHHFQLRLKIRAEIALYPLLQIRDLHIRSASASHREQDNDPCRPRR